MARALFVFALIIAAASAFVAPVNRAAREFRLMDGWCNSVVNESRKYRLSRVPRDLQLSVPPVL